PARVLALGTLARDGALRPVPERGPRRHRRAGRRGRLGLDGRGLLATPRALAPRDRIPGRPRVTAGGRVLGGPSRRLRAEGLAGVAGVRLVQPAGPPAAHPP